MHRHYNTAGAFLLLGVMVAALAGCGKQPVAIVNGTKITQTEFIDRLERAGGREVLADLINRQMIEQAFAAAGLQLTDKEIEDKLNEVVQRQFPSMEAFQQAIAAKGATLDDVKKDIAFGLKLEKLQTKDVKYTEDDVKTFFAKNQKRYDKPLRVTLSVIVTTTQEDAKKVREELNKKDASFTALARQYSINPETRERGGRLPETPIATLQPAVLQGPAQKLPIGGISDPIQVEGQWFVIKVEDRKEAEKAAYDKVKADVERDYKGTKAKSVDQLLQEIRKTAKVTIVSPKFQDLAETYRQQPNLPTFGAQKGGQTPAKGAQPAAPAPDAAQPPQGQPATGQPASGQEQPPAAPAAPAAPAETK